LKRRGERAVPQTQGERVFVRHTKATTKGVFSHSSKCEPSVVNAPPAVMRTTTWAIVEKLEQKISTVVAEVVGRIPLPIAVAAVFERDRCHASLRLAFQEESLCE
jgi:hypothetical protein